MSRYDCDTMRDLIPALVRGELLPHETQSAERHLEVCPECVEEAELVRLMQDTLVPVPAALESRVLLAVRAVRPIRRWAPAHLAMAATLAATVIGGSVVFERLYLRGPETQLTVVEAASELSWAAAEDPMLHGKSQLHEMTLEELEILLAELES